MFLKRLFRFVMYGVILALVAVLGLIGYQYWLGGAENQLSSAESAYESGLKAMSSGDHQTAARKFEEANLKAQQTHDRVGFERERAKDASAEKTKELRELDGKAFWVRARALRDRYFANAAAEGKPIADQEDSTTGEKFRSMFAIKDNDTFREARACLREAAARLPKNPEVLKETLRMELSLPTLDWGVIEPMARELSDMDKADARVHYMLARYEFEQPTAQRTGIYEPAPLERRSRERMQKARDHLTKARSAQGYQLWRSLHLEAQIAAVLRGQATAAKRTAEAQKEDAELRALLLDERSGAMARAAQGEALTGALSAWDIEGLLETQLMAIDLTLEDVREKRVDPSRLDVLFDHHLAFCQKLSLERKGSKAFLGEAAQTAVDGLSRVEPFVTDLASPHWLQRIEGVQALVQKAYDEKVARFDVYERLAQLLARQGHVQARRGNITRATMLNEQVNKWVEKSMKLAEELKSPPSQVAGLHSLAAELRVVTGGKRADVQPHIDALRSQGDPRAVAMANLLDGAMLEREGRLERARQSLELVAASPVQDLALRAHMVLANFYMASAQPERALNSLRLIERVHDQLDQLTPQERNWIYEFLKTPQDQAYLTLVANLETARQKIAMHLREKPRDPMPADLVKVNEAAAAGLLKSFQTGTSHDEAARRAVISYQALTQRREHALEGVAGLRKDYPESLEALQLDISLQVMPAAGQPAMLDSERIRIADDKINAFITSYPQNSRARMMWAAWLMRTNRTDEAVSYLENRSNMPGVTDAQYNQALALAYLRKGNREGASRLLQHLPQNAFVDAANVFIALPQDRDKQLQQALSRHERTGLFRCWEAAAHLERKNYAEAADAYFRALEFTRVKSVAVAGLQRTLLTYGQQDPRAARNLGLKLLKESPTESSLLLPIAYACLLLDELGDPGDSWDRTLTMASALNQWEQIAKDEAGRDLVTVPLTKGEFWAQANRVDRANTELERALARDPQNERALLASINLAVNSGDLDLLPKAEQRMASLKQLKPGDQGLMMLQARIEKDLGQTSEALRTYQKILEKSPKESFAYAQLVNLLERQDRSGAATWVKKWRTELPNDLAAMQAEVRQLAVDGKLPEARQLAEKHIKEAVQKLADQFAAQKPPAGVDVKEWEKQQQTALENAPLEGAMLMAQAFLHAKAYDEAEAWARRVHDKRPDAEGVLMVMGDIQIGRKDWAKARETYSKALAKNKDNAAAANNVAWILAAKLDQPAEAYAIVQEFCKGRHSQKKISGDRLRPEFLDTLGVIYQKLGKQDLYPEMRDMFEAARRRYPNDPRVYLYLGSAYASLQNKQKAQEMFNTAIALAGSPSKTPLSQTERQEVLEAAQLAQKKLQ